MFSKSTILFAGLQATLAAAGNAIVNNRCSYDIWVWSVQPGSSSAAIYIPSGGQYSEPMVANSPTSIKVSKSNTLLGGQQTQFEYSIVNNQLWYDLSFVNCAVGQSSSNCPGADGGLSMSSSNGACGSLNCQSNSYCPTQAYFVDQPLLKLGIPEPVFSCPSGNTNVDLNMNVCADSGSSKRSIAGRLLVDMHA